MQLLKYFTKTSHQTLNIYQLKTGDRDAFLQELINDFRKCYISDKKLSKKARKLQLTETEYLLNYILPDSNPDNVKIVSGDFGEQLSYFTVQEHFSNRGIIFKAPKKWRWKESKNMPSSFSDVILINSVDVNNPSINDIIVTVEAKMKAVDSANSPIQKAIDDAVKDKNSRMIKTLLWLEERYAKKGKEDQVALMKRFNDPTTYGDFKKIHKAVAVIDSSMVNAETAKNLTNTQSVVVIVFSINNLKEAYMLTRSNIVASV